MYNIVQEKMNLELKKNMFLNHIIDLCIKRYEMKADAEDICDVVYDILDEFDDVVKSECVEDLGRDYLTEIFCIENIYFFNRGEYNNDELLCSLIEHILDKEFDL